MQSPPRSGEYKAQLAQLGLRGKRFPTVRAFSPSLSLSNRISGDRRNALLPKFRGFLVFRWVTSGTFQKARRFSKIVYSGMTPLSAVASRRFWTVIESPQQRPLFRTYRTGPLTLLVAPTAVASGRATTRSPYRYCRSDPFGPAEANPLIASLGPFREGGGDFPVRCPSAVFGRGTMPSPTMWVQSTATALAAADCS